jgi:hypothetical protein
MRLAAARRLDRVVILGDLFDACRPTPALIAATSRVLAAGVPVTVLVGNHDQESEAVGHNACAPLWRVAQVIDDVGVAECGAFDVLLVAPWASFTPEDGSRVRLAGVGTRPGCWRVLGLHVGLADDTTPVHLREANDAMHASAAARVAAARGARLVLAGNWHWPAAWSFPELDVEVHQVGTACPHDFRDAGQAGWAIEVADQGQVTRHELPGPRFYKVTRAEFEATWPDGVPPGVYVHVLVGESEAAPSGERVRSTVVAPADVARARPAVLDPGSVETRLVTHARSLVPDHLAERVSLELLEVWRNA